MQEIDVSDLIHVAPLRCLYLDIYGFLDCFPNVSSITNPSESFDFVYVTLAASELSIIPEALHETLCECINFVFNVYLDGSEYENLSVQDIYDKYLDGGSNKIASVCFAYNLYPNKETSDLAKSIFTTELN